MILQEKGKWCGDQQVLKHHPSLLSNSSCKEDAISQLSELPMSLRFCELASQPRGRKSLRISLDTTNMVQKAAR